MKTYRVLVLAFALLLTPSGVAAAEALPCAVVDGQSIADRQSIDRQTAQRRFIGERFVRTELFFGLAKPDGEVTETEFRRFLHECVAPDFPMALRSRPVSDTSAATTASPSKSDPRC